MLQPLVERERELGALRDVLTDALRGRGRLVLLEGAAGIGKTRLLDVLCEEAAAAGVPVLRGRGSPLEQDFPYGVARQLFEAAIFDEGRRDELLGGAAAAAASVLGPVSPDATQTGSFAVLHGLYWLMLNVAGDGPLVIAIDDLHVADGPSTRFVAYLARRLADVPILVAATVRVGEAGQGPAPLAELTSDAATVRVAPRGLTTTGVSALLAEALGEPADPGFRDVCAEATGGNPLLLSQLLVALASEGVAPRAENAAAVGRIGAQAVSRMVLLRMAALPANARAVARAVAVLGDGSSRATIAHLAGIDEDRVEPAARDLAAAGLFDGTLRGFAHGLLRDAVYLDMSADERRERHVTAVDLLHELGAPPEQVAAQLLETPPGGEPWSVEVLRETARAAVARGAPESAVRPLRRLLSEDLPPDERAAVLVELGRAEAFVDRASAIDHLREGYELLAEPVARAQASLVLVAALALGGSREEALALGRREIERMPPGLDDLRCAMEAVVALQVPGLGSDEDVAHLETFARGGRSDGPGGDLLGVVAGCWCMFRALPAAPNVALVRRSLTDRMLAVDEGTSSVTAVIALALADEEDVPEVAERIRAVELKRGSHLGQAALQLWRGFAMFRQGELDEAELLLRDAVAGFPIWSAVSIGPLFGACFLSRVLLERGDVAGAAVELARNTDLDASAEGARSWRRAHAEILIAQGELHQALEVAEESATLDARILCPAADTWRAPMAFALAGLGRTAEAVAIAEEDVALAERFGVRSVVGRTMRVLGTVARDADALAEAVRALEGSPARLEYAKALAAHGAALRRAGHAREAREPLRGALELADRCGATALAGTVRVELKAAGVRPRITALKGPEALTPSERRVAGMAAEGLSNREIAQALFVTPKTVEVHLYNTFRKLEISSRHQLPVDLAA